MDTNNHTMDANDHTIVNANEHTSDHASRHDDVCTHGAYAFVRLPPSTLNGSTIHVQMTAPPRRRDTVVRPAGPWVSVPASEVGAAMRAAARRFGLSCIRMNIMGTVDSRERALLAMAQNQPGEAAAQRVELVAAQGLSAGSVRTIDNVREMQAARAAPLLITEVSPASGGPL